MKMSKEKAEAIEKLYQQLISEMADVNGGRVCDIVVLVHPQHEDAAGKCEGMSLHTNADPIQAHKLAFSFIVWAEQNLDYHQQMMKPAATGTRLN